MCVRADVCTTPTAHEDECFQPFVVRHGDFEDTAASLFIKKSQYKLMGGMSAGFHHMMFFNLGCHLGFTF